MVVHKEIQFGFLELLNHAVHHFRSLPDSVKVFEFIRAETGGNQVYPENLGGILNFLEIV